MQMRTFKRTQNQALAEARRAKVGLEVGGRWSAEAAMFIRLLARARLRSAAPSQRAARVAAFVARWSGFLSVAAARSFAASLLSLPISNTANTRLKCRHSPPACSELRLG